MSKNPTEPSPPTTINNLHLTTELDTYEAACKLDADLQSFDTTLQARTNNVIRTLASGVEVRALSFDSLKEVTECLLEMNQEVVKVILDCKKDIWKNQDLFELVEEYFDNSLKTLDFCSALDKCLKSARDGQLLIHIALQRFEEESDSNSQAYAKSLIDLSSFRELGNPFTDEFFEIFQSVYKHQILMLEKLHLRKNKLDKKLRNIHAWRKVSCVIFAATFASVLICSVVAAAIAAPPVAAALAAATSIPLGSMGKWIDSLLKSYENAVRGQKEIVNYMNVGTYVTIKDLENIRVLIDRLEVEIRSILESADLAGSDRESVRLCADEIRRKLDVLMKNTDELALQADNCSRDIRRARTVVLQRIIKHPNN